MTAFNFEKFSKNYATLNAQKADIEDKMKKLKSRLSEEVSKLEDRKQTNKYATLYFKAPSTRESVDLKKLKADDPDLFEILEAKGYIKVTSVAETFDIKCKAVLLETVTVVK